MSKATIMKQQIFKATTAATSMSFLRRRYVQQSKRHCCQPATRDDDEVTSMRNGCCLTSGNDLELNLLIGHRNATLSSNNNKINANWRENYRQFVSCPYNSLSKPVENDEKKPDLSLSPSNICQPISCSLNRHHRHRKRCSLPGCVTRTFSQNSTLSSSPSSLTLYLSSLLFLAIFSTLVPAASTSPILYSSSSSKTSTNNIDSESLLSLLKRPPTASTNATHSRDKRSAAAGASSTGSAGTVATNLGLLQGRLVQLPNTNIEVYEFLGIPYAEPPVGERRFRKPVPKAPWKDILDATTRSNSCPQLLDTLFDTFEGATMWNANTDMSEDCLYLNIWVPKRILDDLHKNRNQNDGARGLHPVFLWIFGGGFTSGTANLDLYDGRVLSGYNNIIVVTIQYRLGALGFLYFGTDDAPGNMGMWDQLLALKWSCENIHNFGGDCRNTTIFGESAGAASVSLHLLSPHSRPYFQRAIMQSASALSGWAVLTQEEASWRSNELVSKFAATCSPPPSAAAASQSNDDFTFGMPASQPNNPKTAYDETRWKIDCLRSQQFLRLPEEEWGVLASDPAGYAQFPFVPVIDGDFLPRHPRDLLADGQYYNVSVLLGFNKNEGSYFMLYTTKGYQHFRHPRAPNKQMNFTTRIYSELIRDFFAYYPHFNRSTSQIALDAIEFQYTPWRLPVITSQDILNSVDAATGDWAFACPVVSWADSYVELPPAPLIPPPGRPEPPPDYMNDGAGGYPSANFAPAESPFSDAENVRYVRLKRSFASGFSYLQQPGTSPEQGGSQAGGGAAGGGNSGGSASTGPMSAMRNPDSIYSSIPEEDVWYSKHKVFLYYFSQRSSVNPWPAWMGVMHGDEINFIFGEAFNYSKPYTDEEKMLTRFMMAYWSNFAKFGDPNVRDRTSPNQANLDLPSWPEYSYYEKTFLELSVDTLVTKRQPAVGTSIKAQECAFWHGYLPKLDALSGPISSAGGIKIGDASICNGASALNFAPFSLDKLISVLTCTLIMSLMFIVGNL